MHFGEEDIWDVAQGSKLAELQLDASCVALCEREKVLMRSDGRGVYAVRIATMDEGTLIAEEAGVQSLALSPNEKQLVVCTFLSITVYDWQTGDRIGSLRTEPGNSNVLGIAYGDKGLYVLFYDRVREASVLRLWKHPVRLSDDPLEEIVLGDYGWCLAVSRNERFVACGCMDFVSGLQPRLAVWDVGRDKRQVQLKGHKEVRAITSVAFSPEAKFLASAGGLGDVASEVIIWETGKWLPRKRFDAHSMQVNCLGWLPDGKTLVSGSMDGTVKVWDLEGKEGNVGE